MTLHEQLAEVAARRVNRPWYLACGPVMACVHLMAKAFHEDWPRDDFDSRVILRFYHLIDRKGWCAEDEPGVEP